MSNLALNNQETLEKIQSYLETMNMTSNLTKAEIKQFVEIASSYGLNPFKREIYASKFGNSFSIIVGFETYLKRAERSGKLSGWFVETEGSVNYSDICRSDITATITIYRKDWTQPFVHSVHFSEYVQRKGDGTPNKFWKEKPLTMIKKVAMAQGFRLCFSDENGGLPYTSEEIGRDEVVDTQAVVMPTPAVQESNPVQAVVTDSTPSPKKPGRPKKEQKEPTMTLEEREVLKARIRTAMDIDTLLDIYNSTPYVASDAHLMAELTGRKSSIVETEASFAKELEACDTEEKIMALTEKVVHPKLLALAKQKLETLQNTTNNDLF